MTKQKKTKSVKKTISLKKSLGDLMRDEDGFVSKETILKVGLSTVAALGVSGMLTDQVSGQNPPGVTHVNMVTTSEPPDMCVSHQNVTTHTSY